MGLTAIVVVVCGVDQMKGGWILDMKIVEAIEYERYPNAVEVYKGQRNGRVSARRSPEMTRQTNTRAVIG